MRRERLFEYQKREEERQADYRRKCKGGEWRSVTSFSSFKRIQYPVTMRAQDCALWPQIPLFGTTLVPVFAIPERLFARVNGFEVRDIPRLIDFSNDTGRIQFTLATQPMEYEGLDYLDTLFEEVMPPTLEEVPLDEIVGRHEVKMWHEAFHEEAKISLWPLVARELADPGLLPQAKRFMDQLAWSYSWLKALGYESVAETIDNLIATDPQQAYEILFTYKNFVTDQSLNPYDMISCFSSDYISRMNKVGGHPKAGSSKTVYPCEIGAFLTKKLTLIPESLESCQILIERYSQEELLPIVNALSDAVRSSKSDIARAKSRELGAIFDSVWSDAQRMRGQMRGIKFAVSTSFIALGFCAGALLEGGAGGITGLLAGLGLQLAEEHIEGPTNKVARKLFEALSPSQTCAVFDFREKHNV
ncbi:MAG: hypothetical protein JRN33_02970 [Nitrososphaerota archaeon]|jgi:hypothetical protein|nr:hypothetical protein [Nitrososphaerota archaeon]